MARSEPADEEDLPTFSLGLEFLTPEKNLKKRKKEQARPLSSCLAKLLFSDANFAFSEGKHTFSKR